MSRTFSSNDPKETKTEIAKKILEEAKRSNINLILLKGDLGSGKTTFAQGTLKLLGAEGPYTSPTFVVMKRYVLIKPQTTNHKPQINSKLKSASWQTKFNFVYHFDCYRVGAQDILELGWEEIISNPQNLVLVEWPERIEKILPKKFIKLNFETIDESERKIIISKK